MHSIRKVLNFVWRFRFVFIGVVVVTTASATTLDLTKGNITETTEFKDSYIYGDEITYSGKAFMGDVTFEFKREGDEEWSEETPYLPGKYEARGRSQGNHGYKYTKISEFEIKPYESPLYLKETEIDFGNDHPELYCALLPGDYIKNDEALVTYANLDQETSASTIVADSIKVLNSKGDDVTGCYTFNIENKEVTFKKAKIRVDFKQDDVYAYTGNEVRSDSFELKSGTLYYGAHLEYRGGRSESQWSDSTASHTKQYPNDHSIVVLSEDGSIDYTANYDIDLHDNYIEIGRAPGVTFTSKSFSKDYDGQAFSQFTTEPDSIVTTTGSLLNGHHLKITGFDNATAFKAGSYQNKFTYEIVDNDDNPLSAEELAVYEYITPVYGTLSIAKIPITIKSNDVDDYFDNKAHYDWTYEITRGSLAAGDALEIDEASRPSQVAPTKSNPVNNIPTYRIKHGEEDVTACYQITPDWGAISIKINPLKFVFKSRSVVYNALDNFYYAADSYYVGDERNNAAVLADGYTLPDGWTYDVRISNSFTMRNVSANGYKAADTDVTYHIYDESHVDVSSYYTRGTDITFDIPTSTISKKQLQVSVSDYAKEYNGKTLANDIIVNPNDPDTCVIYNGLEGADLPDVNFTGNAANNKNVSATPYSLSLSYGVKNSAGENLSNNYDISFENDKQTINATITKKDIVVTPGDVTKTYNGVNTFKPTTPTLKPSLNPNSLGETVTLKSTLTGTYTTTKSDVGNYTYALDPNDVVIKIGTEDVTNNYNIFLEKTGEVAVTVRDLEINPTTKSQVPTNYIFYDGYEHGAFTDANGVPSGEISIEQATASSNSGLISGHKLLITNQMVAIDANTDMEITESDDLGIVIKDENNVDVTSNYNPTHPNSIYVNIRKTVINIYAFSLGKKFDGMPFEYSNYFDGYDYNHWFDWSTTNPGQLGYLFDVEIESLTNPGNLESGHTLQLTKYTKDCAEAAVDSGTYLFDYEYRVINSNQEDVSDMYSINKYTGTLNVSNGDIHINVNSGGKMYDGDNCVTPVSCTLPLQGSTSASAYVASYSLGFTSKFNQRYTLYADFTPGAVSYNYGIYNSAVTIRIYDSITGETYGKDGVSSLTVYLNKENYQYTISQVDIYLTTTNPTSSGKVIRGYTGYLAPTDTIYFGDEPMVSYRYKYKAENTLDTVWIRRNDGTDVSSNYIIHQPA